MQTAGPRAKLQQIVRGRMSEARHSRRGRLAKSVSESDVRRRLWLAFETSTKTSRPAASGYRFEEGKDAAAAAPEPEQLHLNLFEFNLLD